MTRLTSTRTGLRIGSAHDAPELRPTPRGIAPQPRATGYDSPRFAAWVARVVRRVFGV